MAYKRILTIQDISCLGQCSLAVAMPILSACGHETCMLPTALLSTHTGGFGKPAVIKLGQELEGFLDHWKEQKITFDAILVGYLGSIPAVRLAGRAMEELLAPGGVSIVDPAMADHGKRYSGLDEAYAREMAALCRKADILLPNITEAAMLAGLPYREELEEGYVEQLLKARGNQRVILTGTAFRAGQTGAAIWDGKQAQYYLHPKHPKSYHGTGDMFAAAFTGALMQGKPEHQAAKTAADFVCRAIEETEKAPAHWYGVKFEPVLPWLAQQVQA